MPASEEATRAVSYETNIGIFMKKKYKDRLLKLAAGLKKVPNKYFDLSYITDMTVSDSITTFNERLKKMAKLEPKCGTTACAIGWCPAIFPRTFEWDAWGMVCLKGKKRPTESFKSAEEYFGLSESQSHYLFIEEYYHKTKRGPKSVASRIEAFVNSDGALSKEYLSKYEENQ